MRRIYSTRTKLEEDGIEIFPFTPQLVFLESLHIKKNVQEIYSLKRVNKELPSFYANLREGLGPVLLNLFKRGLIYKYFVLDAFVFRNFDESYLREYNEHPFHLDRYFYPSESRSLSCWILIGATSDSFSKLEFILDFPVEEMLSSKNQKVEMVPFEVSSRFGSYIPLVSCRDTFMPIIFSGTVPHRAFGTGGRRSIDFRIISFQSRDDLDKYLQMQP